ncbi:hypothetical protein F66182_4639 [Fusarium sp. NRRL 66182]|nr:hypothetical protein F66182_4639 [Fusarium sp. NRRL 66182]
MASTQLAQTSPSKLSLSLSPKLVPIPTACTMGTASLYPVLLQANKARHIQAVELLYEFSIAGSSEVLGLMRPRFVQEMMWNEGSFTINHYMRRVILNPPPLEGHGLAEACKAALVDLCRLNCGRFHNCFDRWLAKPESQREFQPIHTSRQDRQDFVIPLPARGMFGAITVGVHLNVYTVKRAADGRESIDRIWVSHRANGPDLSYPGMLDQIVAGGMDPKDAGATGILAPRLTLKREAAEEAGLHIDLDTKDVFVRDQDDQYTQPRLVGSVETKPTIAFYDCKDVSAGHLNEGHMEPGLRFVYDLEVKDPDFLPQAAERGIERFEAMTVDGVKESLMAGQWKPNCGLVMLDFLVRHQLHTKMHDDQIAIIKTNLHPKLPFRFGDEYKDLFTSW